MVLKACLTTVQLYQIISCDTVSQSALAQPLMSAPPLPGEHFATWCKTGEGKCRQVQDLLDAAFPYAAKYGTSYVPVVGKLLEKVFVVLYELYRGWERLPHEAEVFLMMVRMTERTLTKMYAGRREPSAEAEKCIGIIREKIEAGERLSRAALQTCTWASLKRFFTGAITIKSLNKTLCEQNHVVGRWTLEKLKKLMKQGIEAQRRQHEQEIDVLKVQLPTLIDAAVQARHGLEITIYLVSYPVGCAIRALRLVR